MHLDEMEMVKMDNLEVQGLKVKILKHWLKRTKRDKMSSWIILMNAQCTQCTQYTDGDGESRLH